MLYGRSAVLPPVIRAAGKTDPVDSSAISRGLFAPAVLHRACHASCSNCTHSLLADPSHSCRTGGSKPTMATTIADLLRSGLTAILMLQGVTCGYGSKRPVHRALCAHCTPGAAKDRCAHLSLLCVCVISPPAVLLEWKCEIWKGVVHYGITCTSMCADMPYNSLICPFRPKTKQPRSYACMQIWPFDCESVLLQFVTWSLKPVAVAGQQEA